MRSGFKRLGYVDAAAFERLGEVGRRRPALDAGALAAALCELGVQDRLQNGEVALLGDRLKAELLPQTP